MLQLQLPAGEGALNGHPLLDGAGGVDHIGNVGELLTVGRIGVFLHDLALVDMLLEAEQYLAGIDGLDEIVGNLLTDGLLHNMLLLRLGDHHHRQSGVYGLDLLQCLQT